MTDEEIISGLVKISEHVSKTKIEEHLRIPKNSLATILKGNKPVPPKHRDKMIDLIKRGFPPPSIDPEEIQRKIAKAKENIPEHMKSLKLTGGDRIGAEKGQDGLYSYRGGILFQWRDGVEVQVPIPDKYKSQLERFSTPLFDPIEAIDELLAENKALKEENEQLMAENESYKVWKAGFEGMPVESGQRKAILPEKPKKLPPPGLSRTDTLKWLSNPDNQ